MASCPKGSSGNYPTNPNNLTNYKVIPDTTRWKFKENVFHCLDQNGNIILRGEKILVGGNDIYKTVCRKHFRELTKLI